MSNPDGLIEWFRAQLDKDEAKIAAMQREQKRVATAPIFQSHPLGWLDGVDIFVSPDRWRADIEAKRRIIDLHEGDHECSTLDHNGDIDNCAWVVGGNCTTMRWLALPYADRAGYREEWKP